MSVIFLLCATMLVILFVTVLGLPLRGRAPSLEADADHDLAERLAAIDADEAADLIDVDAAEEARLEAKRAALADRPSPARTETSDGKLARFVGFVAIGAAPILGLFIYLNVGAPELALREQTPAASTQTADPAAAIAAMTPEDRAAAIEGMVEGLAARLEQNPGDAAGWRMLARSQLALGRRDAGLDSFRQLLRLPDAGVADWKNFAMARAAGEADGAFPIDPEFIGALATIERLNPGDPYALFYQGGAAMRRGDPAGALEKWNALSAAMPDDAPVRDVLLRMIADAEAAVAAKDGALDVPQTEDPMVNDGEASGPGALTDETLLDQPQADESLADEPPSGELDAGEAPGVSDTDAPQSTLPDAD